MVALRDLTLLIAATVVAVSATAGIAQEKKKVQVGISPERIVTPKPPGWVTIYHAKDHRREVLEYVPKGQTVEAWNEMVTSKIFDRSKTTAHDYNSRTIERFAKLCTNSVKIVGEKEKRFGYDASLAFIECETTPETRKRNKFVKNVLFQVQLAIRGKDALYVAESTWQTNDTNAARPTQNTELLNTITSRLDGVFVCDDRIKEKKCATLREKSGQ